MTDAPFDPDAPVTVSLDLSDPDALLGVLPRHAIVSRGAQDLVVRLDPYPALVEPHPASLESTFLVDFEDDAVRELIGDLPSSPRPDLEDLVARVRETIEPSTDRGLDAASVIARKRRGDCTEFAVLMAALARSFGYPTRVVSGLVIVSAEDSAQAFGHAWTEVLVDEGWQLVDATPIGAGAAIAYLPEGAIRDEGPGFALDAMRTYAAGIRGVRVLAAQP